MTTNVLINKLLKQTTQQISPSCHNLCLEQFGNPKYYRSAMWLQLTQEHRLRLEPFR
ncbi:hypothetical protein APV28_5016 [Comamonas testosteroni]|nr:hypothetical protein APV28_5016 [Comamonas testosteroni]